MVVALSMVQNGATKQRHNKAAAQQRNDIQTRITMKVPLPESTRLATSKM
jgi:hypothetical protein